MRPECKPASTRESPAVRVASFTRKARSPGTALTVLALSLSLSGCAGFMNTYLRGEKLDADIAIPAVKTGMAPEPEKFAGGMSSAIDAANEQRLLYLTAVSRKAATSDAIGAGVIALSAASIYTGITTTADSAKRLLALFGATAGGLYAYNTYYANKEADAAYLSGFRAISCAMLRTRPILFEQGEFGNYRDAIGVLEEQIKTVGNQLDAIAITRGMELDAEKKLLMDAAEKPVKGVAKSATRPAVPRFQKRVIDVRIEAGYDALKRARLLLRSAQLLEQRVDTAGFNLRRRVDLITAAVNEELSRVDKDIPKLDGLLAGIGQTGMNFKAVKPDATFTSTAEKAESPLASSFSIQSDTDAARSDPQDAGGKDKSKNTARQRDPLAPVSAISITTLVDLAKSVNQLYETQRTVSKTLGSYRALGKQVVDLDDCRFGSVAPLKISPDKDEMVVEQGKPYQFAITGGRGIPKAWLLGGIAAEADGKKTLETVVEQSQVIAKVFIPKDAPKGVAYLVVTDGQGQHHEEIALLIEKDPVEPKQKAETDADAKSKNKPKTDAKQNQDTNPQSAQAGAATAAGTSAGPVTSAAKTTARVEPGSEKK